MAYYDAFIKQWGSLSGTTASKVAQINALMVDVPPRAVPIREISAYWRKAGVWLTIKAAAGKYASGDTVNGSLGALAAVDLNDDLRMESVDMTLPIVGQMLGEMVAKKVITQAQSDAVVALQYIVPKVSWLSANGYQQELTINDAAAAGLA